MNRDNRSIAELFESCGAPCVALESGRDAGKKKNSEESGKHRELQGWILNGCADRVVQQHEEHQKNEPERGETPQPVHNKPNHASQTAQNYAQEKGGPGKTCLDRNPSLHGMLKNHELLHFQPPSNAARTATAIRIPGRSPKHFANVCETRMKIIASRAGLSRTHLRNARKYHQIADALLSIAPKPTPEDQ